jgi:hypothetical protein
MENSAISRGQREETRAYMRAYYLTHNGTNRRRAATLGVGPKPCRKCGETKPREAYTARNAHCKACRVKANAERWSADPERQALIGWRSKIKRLYGLTEADYNAMLAAQGDACAICRSTVSWSKNYKHKKNGSSRFMVDHCHATGKVRGLLCTRCNRALGLLSDNAEHCLRASEYLRSKT